MSKISPDGNVKSDIFNDFSLFSLNNINIGQYTAKIIQGGNNVILGNTACKIAVNLNNSIYVGDEAGLNIVDGTSNISIGSDNNSLNTNNTNKTTNNINIGYNTALNSNSITIGDNLENNADINIGYSNCQLKLDNSNIIISDFKVGDITNLGFNNWDYSNDNNSNNKIIIGSYNETSNITINIGSSNKTTNNSLIIGNDINNNPKFSLNINNLICAYENNEEKLIYIGVGLYRNIPIVIGSVVNDSNYNNQNQPNFLINGSLNTDKLIIKNDNNLCITLKGNDNAPDIIYYLPPIPTDIPNLFLTVNRNGTLEWKETTNDMITTIITSGDFICNNMNATNIQGFGYFITNINVVDNTSDDIKEGLRNIYFHSSLITNIFYDIIKSITTDDIKGSITSNIYYNEELYKLNFYKNIEAINTDFINESNTKFYKLNDFYNYPLNHLFNITTDSIKQGSNNLYYSENNFNKYSNQIINNLKEGNNHLYYTNNRFQGVFTNYISSNTTNFLPQGTSNLYYNNNFVESNINLTIGNLITDLIKEGSSNLYITNNRLETLFNSNIPTTDKIKQDNNYQYFNSISNLELNSDLIGRGTSNNYFLNVNNNINNTITINTTTDTYKQGTSNIYLRENALINQYNNYLVNDITTDIVTEKNNNFITNNFYNNDLIINGFIKASNVNDIDININALTITKDELSIGPLTEVINTYDFNALYLDTSLSNIQLKYNDNNYSNFNSNVPFIVIENRVGINNASPIFNLQVGTGTDTAFFSKIHLADSDITTGDYGIMIVGSNNQINGHDLKIQTRNQPISAFTDSIIINSSGNIGIGNNNPQSLLHLNVSLSNTDIILRFTDDTTGHTNNDGLILKKDDLQNGILWNYENSSLIFGTNNNERFKIANNGNCFINVPSSYNQSISGYSQKLTIAGSGVGTNWGQLFIYDTNINDLNYLGLIIKADNVNNHCSIQSDKQGSTVQTPLLLNPRGNNVGIGINNPVETLHVAGNIIATGDITSSFSDSRLKTITTTITNALDVIGKINGYKYKLNDTAISYGFKNNNNDNNNDNNNELIGLMAQEVQAVIPEIVTLAPFDTDKNKDGKLISKSGNNYLSIQYDKIIPYLIEAIKELKEENKIIKSKLNLI